uniref:Aldehyde dehydrogenase domain-containing protein n=1 Tax=Panagrolaimus davidi TaxID=227884 RepID=A0A914PD77_9BILA
MQTASWKIAPAIACGNAVVYKPSPLAPVSAVILAHILQHVGVPDGLVNIVQGGAHTGSAICQSRAISKVSFTGSVNTGKIIAQNAASDFVKPVTLELGGKSSCIIFEDSNIDLGVTGAMMANFFSQGQVCSNASKVLVHKCILEPFTKALVKRTSEMIIGDPLNEATRIGATISAEHLEKVKGYIDGATEEGAHLVHGGNRAVVNGLPNGYFLEPCILSNITPEMKVYKYEIFGSVLCIIPFETDEEALRIANDTPFGLAAGIFTNNLSKAHRFARKLHAGNIYINTFNDVSPYVPFGGFNQSGYGRENGKAAIENYTQIKSVFVNASNILENPF